MPNAGQLLKDKAASGSLGVVTIGAGATVLEAVRRMNDHHIGGLPITDEEGRLEGIFTERDLLVRVVAVGLKPESTKVRDVMTRDPIVCSPDTTLDQLRRLMRERRVRHLPIVAEHALIGLVSIGDLNAAEAKELSETIVFLEQFMTPR